MKQHFNLHYSQFIFNQADTFMEHTRFNDLQTIEDYRRDKLPYEEKESFETYLIDRFMRGELSEKQDTFFRELFFQSERFFEKVKETEKTALRIKDAVKRGTLDFVGPVTAKYSFLDRLQDFLSTPRLVFVAALLMIAIIYPVWQIFQMKSELAELHRPRAISAANYALTLTDDTFRGEPKEILLTKDEDVFIINFNLPKKVIHGYKYEAQILDNKKNVIWEIKGLKPVGLYETFPIYCYKAVFESGEYFLQVFELGETGKKTGEDYLFSFKIFK